MNDQNQKLKVSIFTLGCPSARSASGQPLWGSPDPLKEKLMRGLLTDEVDWTL